MKNPFLYCLLISVLLAACGPAGAQTSMTAIANVAQTQTANPTRVTTPTITPNPLFTLTLTEIPTITPTSTNTPLPATATAQALANLKSDKEPGHYLVNVEIAPGVWRSQGKLFPHCSWTRYTREGHIIQEYNGIAGGTIYIAPTDFEVEFGLKCGNWSYLGPP